MCACTPVQVVLLGSCGCEWVELCVSSLAMAPAVGSALRCAALSALTASRRTDSLQLPWMRWAGGSGSVLDERMCYADRGCLTRPPHQAEVSSLWYRGCWRSVSKKALQVPAFNTMSNSLPIL